MMQRLCFLCLADFSFVDKYTTQQIIQLNH